MISNIHRPICWANVPFNLLWTKKEKKERMNETKKEKGECDEDSMRKTKKRKSLKSSAFSFLLFFFPLTILHNASFYSSYTLHPPFFLSLSLFLTIIFLQHHCLSFGFCFSISRCLFTHTHTHTRIHTPYFISPCVSALSRDYNVAPHYTLWALCQCSRGLKLPKSSDFCHVGTAQLDNWRWKVQIFTLPPSHASLISI